MLWGNANTMLGPVKERKAFNTLPVRFLLDSAFGVLCPFLDTKCRSVWREHGEKQGETLTQKDK